MKHLDDISGEQLDLFPELYEEKSHFWRSVVIAGISVGAALTLPKAYECISEGFECLFGLEGYLRNIYCP